MKSKKLTGEWRIVLNVGTTGAAESNEVELLCEYIENTLTVLPNISDTLHIAVVRVVDIEQTNLGS